jgi:hypothetical protein
MTAKERKLISDISEKVNNNVPSARGAQIEEDIKTSISVGNNKSRHVRSLTSNIFHDPVKEKYNKVIVPNVIEKLEETKEAKFKKSISPGKWEAKVDWKDSKYELIFRKEYEKIPLEKRKDYGANNHKLNTSCPDIVTDEKIDQEVKTNMIQVFRKHAKNGNAIRQRINLSSSFQGHEFYENSYQTDQTERASNNYIIKVDNIDNLNLNLFRKEFATQG